MRKTDKKKRGPRHPKQASETNRLAPPARAALAPLCTARYSRSPKSSFTHNFASGSWPLQKVQPSPASPRKYAGRAVPPSPMPHAHANACELGLDLCTDWVFVKKIAGRPCPGCCCCCCLMSSFASRRARRSKQARHLGIDFMDMMMPKK